MTSQCDDTQLCDESEGEQCDDTQCDESQGEAPHWDKEARWLEHHWGDESGDTPTTPEGWAEASAEMKTANAAKKTTTMTAKKKTTNAAKKKTANAAKKTTTGNAAKKTTANAKKA